MTFLRTISYCLLFTLALAACVFQGPTKKAYKKLQKEKFEKAEALLTKSMVKDSINPAANWLLSELYLDTAFQQQNIDTAHYFIEKALADLAIADKKQRKALKKLKADSTTLLEQSAQVDSAAFERAAEINTEASYNYFLANFAGAIQTEKAVERRDSIAFALAEEVNTYQAYKEFLKKYPNAPQAPEAQERYEELLFKAETKTGSLNAYINFLKQYPTTPYKDRLLKNIYLLSTANHEPESYLWYIRNYPAGKWQRQAVEYLYYLNQNDTLDFFQKYPNLPYADSLRKAHKLTQEQHFPVLTDGKWQFINTKGEVVLPAVFNDIHPDYLCETVKTEFVEVSKDGKPLILAKNNYPLYTKEYQAVEQLGAGLLVIQSQKKKGLLFKNGHQVLPIRYDDIRKVNNWAIAVEEDKLKGLLTYNGQWLLLTDYSAIDVQYDFVIIRNQNNKLTVSTKEKLVEALQKNVDPALFFDYDAAQVINDQLIVLSAGQEQVVLDKQLKRVFGPVTGSLKKFKQGWILQKDSGYEILNNKGENTLNARFANVLVREPWIAFRTDKLWGLYQAEQKLGTFDVYDSVMLLTPNLIVTQQAKEIKAQFINKDTVQVSLAGKDYFRVIRPRGLFSNDTYFFTVTDGNAKEVYNQYGKLVIKGRYKEVNLPTEKLLLLKGSSGTSVADTSGNILLKPVYDAVGNYQDGYFATLENSRFGIFNPEKNIQIKPAYDAALRPYNDKYLIASRKKEWGLIDLNGKKVLDFKYELIEPWADTVALAKNQRGWSLIDIKNGQVLRSDIARFKLIKNTPEEKMATIYTDTGLGVISSTKGELVASTYDEVFNLGTEKEPVFYAEKKVQEADMYVVVYINNKGDIIFKQAYSREDWQKLLCD